MSKRYPLNLWIVVVVFLAAATAVPLTFRVLRRPVTPPPKAAQLRTLAELEEALSQDAPELRVVPSAKDGNVEAGIYLCNDSRSWKQLSSVTRSNRDADKWKGVVYCEHHGGNISSIPEREIQMWGEHAMRIGPFLCFGDPDLLRRIDQIIRNRSNEPHFPRLSHSRS